MTRRKTRREREKYEAVEHMAAGRQGRVGPTWLGDDVRRADSPPREATRGAVANFLKARRRTTRHHKRK